ncbi:MAG: hypothetical protein VB031_02170 [Eubacteriaceae bacterium]|nr:hypothetical protein [Eubacteriaceae bacterium]
MIETTVLKALRQLNIADSLAEYSNAKAIFYQAAPPDKDAGWSGSQYPRLDYNITWQYNPERKTAGTMAVNVWCLIETATPPEDIAIAIQDEIDATFFTDADGTYCATWARSDPFEITGTEPQMIGVTVYFDVWAFPAIGSIEPNPAAGFSAYVKAIYPDAKYIGVDTLAEIWKATDSSPAFYARMQGDTVQAKQTTWACATITANMMGHVIAPSQGAANNMIRGICQTLAIDGEISLPYARTDWTPMIITQLAYSTSANPMQQGQITLKGDYRILRAPEENTALEHINITGG